MVITIMFRLASATQTILWPSDSRGRKQWPVTRSLLEHVQVQGDIFLASSAHYQGRVSVHSVW